MIRLSKKNVLIQLNSLILLIVIIVPVSMVCKENNSVWKNKHKTSYPLGKYRKVAVSAIAKECADVGVHILAKNGSAVDAAIALLLCEGVVSFQSMGIGGGFSMTIWNATTKTAHSLIARETASRHATPDMFHGNANLSSFGGLAIALPGELLGYWEAHKKFGKLDWNELFQPAIDLCREGFRVNDFLHSGIKEMENQIRANPKLARVLTNPVTHQLYKLGDIIRRPKFGRTLVKLSASDGSGVKKFYNGTIAKNLVREIQKYNGILDEEDFRNYRALWKDPIQVQLGNLKMYTSPPPGSGALLAFMMNVLEGFVFEKDIENVAYQRMVETFKWAFARRTELGDSDFESEVDDLVKKITSKEYAKTIRNMIKDNSTSPDPKFYGAVTLNPDDHGTYHACILDNDGSAVSVTSTINGFFGSLVLSKSTGIIFNNNMDDFAFPNITNSYGVPPSPTNFIKPGKRPLSSTTPTIVVDENNEVRLVVGGAGGTKITTSVALTMILNLWRDYDLKEAVEAHRIHHQLLPMNIVVEPDFPSSIQNYLHLIGHNITTFTGYPNLVTAISQKNGIISAYSDYRRQGKISGI